MRGVAAGGFVQAFSDAGLANAFDSVHGSSAGACAGAYFLSGQPEAGRAIYREDICNRRVVNPYRFWSHPAMVDTDFIVDEVIAKKRALDIARILDEPGVLNIVTSRVSDGAACLHNSFESSRAFLDVLRATLRIPGIREPGVKIGEQYHLDGGLVAPIPLFSAQRAGATHVLIVGTQRPQDYASHSGATKIEAGILTLLYGPALASAYRTAQGKRTGHADAGAQSDKSVDFICRPVDATDCGWSTIDQAALRRTELEAMSTARAYLK
jgi:predicted patatin/cPLA2 family phospholipase